MKICGRDAIVSLATAAGVALLPTTVLGDVPRTPPSVWSDSGPVGLLISAAVVAAVAGASWFALRAIRGKQE